MTMGLLAAILPSLIGGGMSLFGSRGKDEDKGGGLFTRPGEEKRFERFTPQQQQLTDLLRNILTGQGQQPQGGLLGNLLGEGGFESYAQPAIRAFQEQIVPGIAERFSGGFGVPGAASAQRSSGFQQQLARSGEDLATRLGEMRGQQQQQLLGPLLQQIMQPQFHTQYTPGGPTGLATGLGQIAQGLGQGLGQGFGGGLSGMLSGLVGGGR